MPAYCDRSGLQLQHLVAKSQFFQLLGHTPRKKLYIKGSRFGGWVYDDWTPGGNLL